MRGAFFSFEGIAKVNLGAAGQGPTLVKGCQGPSFDLCGGLLLFGSSCFVSMIDLGCFEPPFVFRVQLKLRMGLNLSKSPLNLSGTLI